MNALVNNLPARFWAKVNKTETCWLWTGSRDGYGYGLYRHQGAVIRAHRLILISCGHDMKGRVTRHKCDTAACVRPDHLQPGTQSDNICDSLERGRWPDKSGERNGRAKLTPSDVIAIREKYAALSKNGRCSKASLVQIAAQYGISWTSLNQIKNRKTWRHL